MENLKNLEKITKIFQPQNIITSDEIEQVLKGIIDILASYKKGTDSINEETKAVVNQLLEKTMAVEAKMVSKIDSKVEDIQSTADTKIKEIKGLLKEVNTFLEDVQTLAAEVKDGKDADEEKIVEDVISRIKIDPTVVTMSAEEVRDKLASLKDDARLDTSSIKGFDLYSKKVDLDYAIQTLQQQASFLINRGGLKNVTAGTNVTIDYTDPSNPVISSSGGGGSGSPGGSNTQLQYNNAGNFGGISGATTDGTAVTYTTGNLIGADVKASGSGGLALKSNNGTTTSLHGAGGGANNTFYGDVKLDYATATTVPYLDASKNLISSAVTPTELGYVSGVTSSIQTQLNAKGAGTVTSVSSANSDITVANQTTTPTMTLNSDTAATASTIAKRDANGILTGVNFNEGYSTTATAAGTTTLTVGSNNMQYFTGSTTQTVVMPVTSTLTLGHSYWIINRSTGLVTVNSSGGNAIIILAAGTSAEITCILTSGTTAASWDAQYFGANSATGKKVTVNNTLTLAGTDNTTMTFPTTSATIARTDAANTFTGVQTMTSPAITTSITTSSTSFTAFAGATTLLTIGGTGASASLFAPSTLDTTSSTTGAIRTSGGISAAKAANIGTSLTVGTTIELGNASDTTLSRSAAGQLAVEGVDVLTTSNTKTVTNKRPQPRTASSTTASTLTPDLSSANVYYRTTQTASLTINAPTGTPVIGETIAIYVDSVGAQTLTMDSTYKAFGAAFPASTTAGKTLMITAQYNGTDWKTLWATAV